MNEFRYKHPPSSPRASQNWIQREAKRREVEGSKEQAVRSRGGSDNGLRGEGVDQDFQARGPMLTAS